MIGAYFIFVVIVLIIMLVMVAGDKKCLSADYGMVIGNFIVLIITVVLAETQESLGAGDELALHFAGIVHFIGIVVIFSLTKRAKKNIELCIPAFLVGIIATVVIGFLSVFIPVIISNIQINTNRRSYIKKVESYLTTKYGDGNFKVTSSSNYYDDDKFSRYLSYYTYYVSTDYMDEEFTVWIYPGGKIDYDTFIPRYYIDKYDLPNRYAEFDNFIEESLKVKYPDKNIRSYDIENKIYGSNTIVCSDCGRIPTIDELIELLYND